VKRVFWCGSDDGCADELSLKTMETAGIVGVAPSAGVVLHGLEEALVEGDLVVLIDPPRADAGPLQKYLIDGTPARVITLAPEPVVGACWTQPDLGPWSAPLRLVAGWRLLLHLAAAIGRDPDKPSRARKVGNPVV
jgi:glucosamine--fructose-6-phosphate aminotransferase (isomerizing)